MKPAPFAYHAPSSIDEALALLHEHGSDAKALAGGQSLIPAMNFRLATPAVLVDLNRVDSLRSVSRDTATLQLGAMTRHRTLEQSQDVAQMAPLVSAAMPFVAHEAIRTRGTIGGSLAHADPAAELPAVMLALDASFTLASRSGSRVVPASAFFAGLFATAMEPGELLVNITIPARADRSAAAFDEVSRRHGDFALAGAAAYVVNGADGNARLHGSDSSALLTGRCSPRKLRGCSKARGRRRKAFARRLKPPPRSTSIRPATSTPRAATVVNWRRS
jgi:CO/xanthine dehydrogenase FAD-binding subunit